MLQTVTLPSANTDRITTSLYFLSLFLCVRYGNISCVCWRGGGGGWSGDIKHWLLLNIKLWWHQPLFLFIFYISYYTIHSFIHPFAEGPLLFPHCSPLSRRPPWGAEPGFELEPAAYSKPMHWPTPHLELRRTLIYSLLQSGYILLQRV